jgi:hypothetical protein
MERAGEEKQELGAGLPHSRLGDSEAALEQA